MYMNVHSKLHVTTKYGIKNREASDLLDCQLKEEWQRSVNAAHDDLFEVFWVDVRTT